MGAPMECFRRLVVQFGGLGVEQSAALMPELTSYRAGTVAVAGQRLEASRRGEVCVAPWWLTNMANLLARCAPREMQ